MLNLKRDFPIFIKHPELVYLDSTATSLKPQIVVDKETEYYKEYSANIFRGIYKISEKATEEYEKVRKKTAHLLHSNNPQEIIFVRNATEGLNIIMDGIRNWIGEKDELVTTIMEHHANFVTWQQLSKTVNCKLQIAYITNEGSLDIDDLLSKVNRRTKLVAFTHVSNVLGTINPVKVITQKIKQKNPNCLVVIDGAQAVPHLSVDVLDLGCDFYVFSSHKMLGPTGVGVLWGKYKLLKQMKPYQFGGEMIKTVYIDHSDFKDPPYKFEAGTPNIAGVIGFGAAIDYLTDKRFTKIRQHEIEITHYAMNQLNSVRGIRIYGPQNAGMRSGVVAFTIPKVHPHDIAQILDSDNICIRSGHHCAMPLHVHLGLPATARASFYIYTTREDIDKFIEGLHKVQRIMN